MQTGVCGPMGWQDHGIAKRTSPPPSVSPTEPSPGLSTARGPPMRLLNFRKQKMQFNPNPVQVCVNKESQVYSALEVTIFCEWMFGVFLLIQALTLVNYYFCIDNFICDLTSKTLRTWTVWRPKLILHSRVKMLREFVLDGLHKIKLLLETVPVI